MIWIIEVWQMQRQMLFHRTVDKLTNIIQLSGAEKERKYICLFLWIFE